MGLDVGGANLKYASTDQLCHHRRFAIWRESDRLTETIATDLARFAAIDALVVTMTGELADCFPDRAVGVAHIVAEVSRAAAVAGVSSPVFYAVDGCFLSGPDALVRPDAVAASNWHALASWVGESLVSDGLLVDVGSTTTDLIPIRGGAVATTASCDHERLRERSLVYIGCRRTPVCALVDRLEFAGRPVPVMNEVFATIDDARLLVGTQSADPEDLDTADSRPRTPEWAVGRLARMVGLDRRQITMVQARGLAEQVIHAAVSSIRSALDEVQLGCEPTIVLSGHGHDLVPCAGDERVIDLAQRLGAGLSRSAPSYAVAWQYDRKRRLATASSNGGG